MYNKDHDVYPVLQNIGKEITQKVKPKAVVVFSAHWQAKPDLIEVNNGQEAELIYEFVPYPLNSAVMKADRLTSSNQLLWLPRLYVQSPVSEQGRPRACQSYY